MKDTNASLHRITAVNVHGEECLYYIKLTQSQEEDFRRLKAQQQENTSEMTEWLKSGPNVDEVIEWVDSQLLDLDNLGEVVAFENDHHKIPTTTKIILNKQCP